MSWVRVIVCFCYSGTESSQSSDPSQASVLVEERLSHPYPEPLVQ